MELPDDFDERMREVVERLIRYDTTDGNEQAAQEWLETYLSELGFETYSWLADAEQLAEHPSFPPAEDLDVADRPSVAGVLEFGDPDAGRTLILNGHIDVVPVEADHWSSDPFEPTWDDGRLIARGAVDMKSQLVACVFAAKALEANVERDAFDGRIVVESVVGEEEGGVGAAAAALSNPYPFDRDAAIMAEPTELAVVTATEGTCMKRLEITGRSAHAATRWRGEDVLPHFERIRHAFMELEAERAERVTHPLYDRFENPWPIVIGTVQAGSWASNVPANLVAELRLGVSPSETVDDVEAEFEDRLASVVADNEWLSEHPPTFERFSIQFEPGEIAPDEPVVGAVQDALAAAGVADTSVEGRTYGADNRHYIEAGIPTVVFGPGAVEEAHFPNESVEWAQVLTGTELLADAAHRFLAG
ncbi:MAG: ArgE/DapE family deacylase [Halobacteriales archaeon]|nr:ArgE/DapE family deacylase [Halobacteriales archaeon]